MSVHFSDVKFTNSNNIAVDLEVEAPIGNLVAGPTTVPPKGSITLNPGVQDCLSVRLRASTSHHNPDAQAFEIARPAIGQHAFLVRVEAVHVVGSIQGLVVARTERMNWASD